MFDLRPELIFISIASYRDHQLVPTVSDLLAKAEHPERLRLGICWQHGQEDQVLPFATDERFKILDVDWRLSRGACWARAETMGLWDGEEWYLQVDSHCRFISGWDTKLIRMMTTLGSKAVLSTYASPFKPAQQGDPAPEILEGPPYIIAITGFSSDGIPELKPLAIPRYKERESPIPARFLAGGFLFAPGSFVLDVPYDPEIYFLGEECSMTVRAYTSGYDLFHPPEAIVWHDYGRSDATRHWQDHDDANPSSATGSTGWTELDLKSKAKVRALITGDALEVIRDAPNKLISKFGLGTNRTLNAYEQYAGLDFRRRRIQDHARQGLEPPNPVHDVDWATRIYPWLVRVTFDPVEIGADAFSNKDFWMVLIEDEYHQEIFRQDFREKDLALFDGKEPLISLICEFESGVIPKHWVVWPHNSASGWGMRVSGVIPEQDYCVIRPDF